MRLLRSMSLLLLTVLFFYGCNEQKTSDTIDLPSETVPTTPGTNTPAVTKTFSLTAEFPSWLKVHLQKFGAANFDVKCEIAATASPTDLLCMLHVKELDLYAHKFDLKINAPKEICDYLVQAPYWYYDRVAGTLPATSISFNYDSTAGVASSCPAGFSPSGKYCASTELIGGVPRVRLGGDGEVKCAFDYTDSDGPNCCEGSYSYLANVNDGTTITATAYQGKYNGRMSACIAGPAATNAWPVTKSGFPVSLIQELPSDGTLVTYKINAAIDETGRLGNTFAANFYDWATYNASSTGALSTTYPTALTGGGYGAPTPSRAYEYRCLNRAMEIKHRIRLFVNEWDTTEAFDTYVSASSTTAQRMAVSPINNGTEGVDCATSDSIGLGSCNDIADWDDYAPLQYPSEK